MGEPTGGGRDRPVGGRSGWWGFRRVAVAVLLACLLGGTAFSYRFNMLGGSLGGFNNDHYDVLLGSEMLLRGEQPMRDFTDFELKAAWPALSYAVPAWAQQIGGRNMLTEAYLTVGALALAAALVFLLALELSRRWTIAVLVAVLVIATGPHLYNYTKVLTLTLGALALLAAVKEPTTRRLSYAAAATALAVLFRHDLGVYLGVGTVVGLLARDAWAWTVIIRNLGVYASITAGLLLPGAVWIQFYQGIPSYLASNMEISRLAEQRTHLSWPVFDGGAPLLSSDNLVPFMYYAFWLLLTLGALVLVWRTTAKTARATPVERGVGSGLLAMGDPGDDLLSTGQPSGAVRRCNRTRRIARGLVRWRRRRATDARVPPAGGAARHGGPGIYGRCNVDSRRGAGRTLRGRVLAFPRPGGLPGRGGKRRAAEPAAGDVAGPRGHRHPQGRSVRFGMHPCRRPSLGCRIRAGDIRARPPPVRSRANEDGILVLQIGR